MPAPLDSANFSRKDAKKPLTPFFDRGYMGRASRQTKGECRAGSSVSFIIQNERYIAQRLIPIKPEMIQEQSRPDFGIIPKRFRHNPEYIPTGISGIFGHLRL